MNILCDTNAITALRLGNQKILEYFETADTIYLSVIVLGELLSGFKNGSRIDYNLKFLEAFRSKSRVEILGLNDETSMVYSDLYTILKKSGSPIPTNDLWIAAQCVEKGAGLVTGDRHIDLFPTIRKETW
jgi:tRNA(fMet)-specific endonuclease VapC